MVYDIIMMLHMTYCGLCDGVAVVCEEELVLLDPFDQKKLA